MKFLLTSTVILLLFTTSISLGDDLRGKIEEHHFAYIPDGEGRFQALIMAPGCSGIASDDQNCEGD
jgi:hypothetical protein